MNHLQRQHRQKGSSQDASKNFPKNLLKNFGKRLSYIRAKKRLSLRYLAAISRLDPSDILKYENGAVSPTLTTIARLARALGVHPKDLMEFEIDWQTFQ